MTPRVITFFVPGLVKGQPRPRAFARKFGAKYSARVYDPGTAEGWKSAIAVAVRPYLENVPLVGAVSLTIECVMPRPKRQFIRSGLRPGSPTWHTCKPDFDNVLKAASDALTVAGLWRDDAQVCKASITRTYGERVGAQFTIEELEEPK